MDVELTLSGQGPLVHQVFAALRARMESGALEAGTRLPGSRRMARNLGVSRGTVVSAYEQLDAEGYCYATARSGTRVADLPPRPEGAADGSTPPRARHTARWRMNAPALPLDLRFGLPNAGDFPHPVWLRLARRELKANRDEWFSYPHPEGLPRLRVAIAAYLRRRRGLACSAADVLITHGAQQAFSLVARALLPAGVAVAVEDPGYRGFAQAAVAAGLTLVPVPVDRHGLVTDALERCEVSAAYVTPAHQFPSGVLLAAPRRHELLAWAERHDTWIIEDDYDSEYRFDAPPLDPLKALDASGRVLLVGSFSKTVFPGLRVGYVVAAPELLQPLVLLKNLDDAGSDQLIQAVLASFIEDGHYERHLRRSVRNNALRRGALIDALTRAFGSRLRLLGTDSGLHLVADLGLTPDQEQAVITVLRRRGVGLYAQSTFAQGPDIASGLVLGYGTLEPPDLAAAVGHLAQAVAGVAGTSGRVARRSTSR